MFGSDSVRTAQIAAAVFFSERLVGGQILALVIVYSTNSSSERLVGGRQRGVAVGLVLGKEPLTGGRPRC